MSAYKAKVYFSTFYLGEISKQLSNDIKKIVSQSYPQVNLLIIFKTHSTIGGQFTFKDKQPLLNRSNLIYRYTCECCKAFYIGKTERQLGCASLNTLVSLLVLGNHFQIGPNLIFSIIAKNVTLMFFQKISL